MCNSPVYLLHYIPHHELKEHVRRYPYHECLEHLITAVIQCVLSEHRESAVLQRPRSTLIQKRESMKKTMSKVYWNICIVFYLITVEMWELDEILPFPPALWFLPVVDR
jgi:hypothetical protein